VSARVAVVIPAGGLGRRMGGVKKQYLDIQGQPLILHTLRPFLARPDVAWIVVALPAEDVQPPPAWAEGLDARVRLVAGGAERGDSVARGLEHVPEEADVVIIHDAARPLVTPAIIERTLNVAAAGAGAVAAVPVGDTIKEVDADGAVRATPDRSRLWRAQTPQAFPRGMIVAAYRRALAEGFQATDDAAVVERYGGRVQVVEGAPENLKVTGPADVIVAEALLRGVQRG
jgi:2-C-methyl-D-erythritol 4-phosphate cytidylyltransferase